MVESDHSDEESGLEIRRVNDNGSSVSQSMMSGNTIVKIENSSAGGTNTNSMANSMASLSMAGVEVEDQHNMSSGQVSMSSDGGVLQATQSQFASVPHSKRNTMKAIPEEEETGEVIQRQIKTDMPAIRETTPSQEADSTNRNSQLTSS